MKTTTRHRRLQSVNVSRDRDPAEDRRRRLTRVLAFALRHQPTVFGLELDRQGWTGLAELFVAVQSRHGWESLSISEIEQLVREDGVSRFEIDHGRIRALYGHSVRNVQPGTFMLPPPLLFHATRAAYFTAIRVNGIGARSRIHVHLTSSLAYAVNVKTDHESDGWPGILFGVETKKAFVPFYKASEVVWTAPYIPPSALVLVIPDASNTGYQVLPLSNSTLSCELDMASYVSLLRDETDAT